jgi:hypothetical protein
MYYGYAEIWQQAAHDANVDVNELKKKFTVVKITLDDDDTAYAPGTTKKVFVGPGKVTYQLYPDGGAEAYPADGTVLRHLSR